MKTITKILIPIIVVLTLGLFYLFIVLNGYSPYPQGMGLLYYSDSSEKRFDSDGEYGEYKITKITDEDLIDAPRLKKMLDVALAQEFPLHDDGFAIIDGSFNSYWLNREGADIRIQNSMSTGDVSEYRNWLSNNAESNFIEYNEKIFRITFWIA